jgi:antitoxin (DNA-binding transcriptional repressor) of toxin-antitoxin stability system
VVDQVARSGRPAVVTKRGRPVAALVPLDEDAFLDWVLANAPEFAGVMAEADRAHAQGRWRGVELGRVASFIDDDDALDKLIEEADLT